ncbi:MAG: hypothetical protein QOD58_3396, partial [Mycobacterium sp.]|nr:hypothetical protein [Mycobacterium sp.]
MAMSAPQPPNEAVQAVRPVSVGGSRRRLKIPTRIGIPARIWLRLRVNGWRGVTRVRWGVAGTWWRVARIRRVVCGEAAETNTVRRPRCGNGLAGTGPR